MDASPDKLASECARAAREFLSIEGWHCPKAKVRAAVKEMLACSKRSTTAMAWLLNEIAGLPVQTQPARRLKNLIQAISAWRDRRPGGSPTQWTINFKS